ncbi:DnaB-like helicase N-terminal domain-containing protein [Streptomyces sp. adm13(2018)]|uniref:DnaB-like helicase N-terminal domain-containing protein n=1 Tax=Streptomyces sp. adm13(2018) TaxID=2479007 RepID=UPI0021C926C3|nr:DnaB-like helicase N-terminal domain-containing protein [Streptomyces sp. adm13(2018)]
MNPLLNAEQAVLGAVLLDPGQLSHLEWLAPDHFYRPVHQALFAALRKLRGDGHPAVEGEGPVPLSWVTDAVAEAGLHVRGLTASYAHLLVSACPRPAHAPVYGRMVLEGAIHRTVTQHAIRLHQEARAGALRGEVEGALHYADVLTGVLTDLARRWGTEPRPVAPATSQAPDPPALPPARADRVAEDEEFLLAVSSSHVSASPNSSSSTSHIASRAAAESRPLPSPDSAVTSSSTISNRSRPTRSPSDASRSAWSSPFAPMPASRPPSRWTLLRPTAAPAAAAAAPPRTGTCRASSTLADPGLALPSPVLRKYEVAAYFRSVHAPPVPLVRSVDVPTYTDPLGVRSPATIWPTAWPLFCQPSRRAVTS